MVAAPMHHLGTGPPSLYHRAAPALAAQCASRRAGRRGSGGGQPVYLRDLWPTPDEIQKNIIAGIKPEVFTRQYSEIFKVNPQWQSIQTSTGKLFLDYF